MTWHATGFKSEQLRICYNSGFLKAGMTDSQMYGRFLYES